jgi:aspartyl-tRNA(Asn)/glutamyl-tRNA(Gln) amidotransferase subunit B
MVANWVMGDLLRHLNEENKTINDSPVTPEMLVSMIGFMDKGTISGKIAKEVFSQMYDSGDSPAVIIKEKNLVQVSDESEIVRIVEEMINENKDIVKRYRTGEEKVFGFLVGQLMKKSKGKVNPAIANKILLEKLQK